MNARAGRGYFWRLDEIAQLLHGVDTKIAAVSERLHQKPLPDPKQVFDRSLVAVRQYDNYLDELVNEQRLTRQDVSELKRKVARSLDSVQELFPEPPVSKPEGDSPSPASDH